MHRLTGAGGHCNHLVGSRNLLEDCLAGVLGQPLEGANQPLQPRPFRIGEVVFVSGQDVERLAEHPVVDRGLDVEHLDLLFDELAHLDHLVREVRPLGLHVGFGLADGAGVVVTAQRTVPDKAGAE